MDLDKLYDPSEQEPLSQIIPYESITGPHLQHLKLDFLNSHVQKRSKMVSHILTVQE